MPVRIGEMLLKQRLITTQQLQEAVSQQKVNGGKVGPILIGLGYVKDEDLTALLSRQYGVPSINLSQFEIDVRVARIIPSETARKYQVIPVSRSGATLTIAMTDPTDVFAMDDIKFMTGYNVETVVASETAVLAALDKYYRGVPTGNGSGGSTLEIATRELAGMSRIHDEALEILEDSEELDVVTLEQQSGEAPVVRMVNVLLASAIHKGASDVHIEPYEKEFRVRFRIDGVLHNVMVPPMKMKDAVTSRIKIMAKLDIAEKRLPQDGRIKMRFRDAGATKELDLRVSCLPTLFGEKIVLRLLDRSTLIPVDILVSDVRMPDMNGVDLLREAKRIDPHVIGIMITAFASTESAVEALRLGAHDYVSKPFDVDELKAKVHEALEHRRLREENAALKKALASSGDLANIVGDSPAIQELKERIRRVAPTRSTVLVTGESGTGKELVARAVHAYSTRRAKPFVAVNGGALPEMLLESELFGHVRGAFTGADRNKKGLIEVADQGTILLNEIGELSPVMQVKLLRVLQERRFRRVGATRELDADIRVIAATNRPPWRPG